MTQKKPLKETVSIRINPDLWENLRIMAISRKIPASELLEQILTGKIKLKITIKRIRKDRN